MKLIYPFRFEENDVFLSPRGPGKSSTIRIFSEEDFKKKSALEIRNRNVLVIGTPGKSYHIRTFKEENFNKDLAPTHASIEYIENNGEKIVRMTY